MSWYEEHIAFSIFGRRVTIFGFNAMHVAINVWTRRWGYVCFHPTMRVFGRWWPWYFYVSPNATPWAATFAIGPGLERLDKHRAPIRRAKYGHNYSTDELASDEMHSDYGFYKKDTES